MTTVEIYITLSPSLFLNEDGKLREYVYIQTDIYTYLLIKILMVLPIHFNLIINKKRLEAIIYHVNERVHRINPWGRIISRE